MRTVLTAAMALVAMAAIGAQTAIGPAAQRTAPMPVPPDRATLLREIGIAHGMLRGLQYNDATTTAQYQATGTQYIVGQAFKPGGPWPAAKLTKYNVWVNYAVPGIRIDLERTNPDGPVQGGGGLPFASPQRQILVVGDSRAWNETMMPGGPATPAIGQEKDRAVQIWMLPQGAVKAARMAGDKLAVGMEGGRIHGSNHADTMLIAYLPKTKLLVEADLWNPGAQPNAPAPTGIAATEPSNLWNNIQRLKLDVTQIAPLHGRLVPFADFQRAVGSGAITH
jgi:hypothetical protein